MIRILTRALFVCLVSLGITASSSAQGIASQSGFGTEVALAGHDILVGEPLNQRISGMLYVYRQDSVHGWTEVQALSADDGHPGDRFAVTVAVDGDRLIAGATRSDEARGAVYLFERGADGNWEQQAKIQPHSASAGDRFGAGLLLMGDKIAASSTPFEGAGRVFLFEETQEGWVQTAQIDGDSTDGNLFGTSLNMINDALIVGSPSTQNGAVYIYRQDRENGVWAVSQKLVGRPGPAAESDEASLFRAPAGDMYGTKIEAHGDLLLVTAPNAKNFMGVVYAYRHDESGRYRGGIELLPFDAQPRHLFAREAVFAGDQILIGASGVDNFMGAVYALDLDRDSQTLTSATKWIPEELTTATLFGGSIAANERLAIVGAQQDARGYGSAIVYEKGDDGSWNQTSKLGSELQVEFTSVTGGTVKCEEGDATSYPCKNVDLVSYVSLKDLGGTRGAHTNDVWGWTDSETGKEYALVGRNDATSFVDISNPENPIVLGSLDRTEGSPISTWRDIKAYKDHAFIVADGAGAHGVQIFDLTQLRDVENPPVAFKETAHYDRIHSAHNIVINEETGFAYTVGNRSGGETCAGGSHMINIQDPTNPTFAGCFAHVETGRQGTGYTHDGQCVVYSGPDERYSGHEICFGANETAVSIADVSDKDNPVAISTGNYPNPGYTHQGWLSDDHRYFFVNDELDEINGSADGTRTLIWDVAELDDPILVNEHVSQNKASDHNLYVRGNYMYQSNYVSGLRIVDISDVENPVEVGYFDTVNWGHDQPGFGGTWSNFPFFESGVIVVTSGEEGVFFLKRSDVEI